MFRTLPYERAGRTILHLGVKMMTRLVEFFRDESGATAIEYGLIAAGISVAIVAAVMSLGTQLNSTFSTVTSQLASAGK
jgi:pilus assembly protein Flp/PilA